mmetsp:Transcript_17868/g.37240  ORF Transcript_17868/g.37240 Transcript_17868/m.37240 type:complete len:262 (-) Transcript_17868:1306-2091(-)
MSKEVIVRNVLIEMKIHGKGLDGFIQNIRYICQIPLFMYCGIVFNDIIGIIVGNTVRESDFRPASIHDGKRGDPASHGVIATDIVCPTSPGFILIGNEEGMLGEFSTVGRVLVSAMRGGEDDCPAIGGPAIWGFEDGACADVGAGIDEEEDASSGCFHDPFIRPVLIPDLFQKRSARGRRGLVHIVIIISTILGTFNCCGTRSRHILPLSNIDNKIAPLRIVLIFGLILPLETDLPLLSGIGFESIKGQFPNIRVFFFIGI